MKPTLLIILLGILVSCGSKPGYTSSAGKKKAKKYNSYQYNDNHWGHKTRH